MSRLMKSPQPAPPAPPSVSLRVANPFVNDSVPWSSPTEVVKTIIVGVTLVPVRIVVIAIALVFGSLWLLLVSLCATPVGPDPAAAARSGRAHAIPPFRMALLSPVRWSCRAILWGFGYWWIEEVFPPGVPLGQRLFSSYLRRPDVPRVIVANHQCFMDAFFVGSRLIPTAVGKAELVRAPLAGAALAALEPILVPRTPEDRARLPPVLDQIVFKARSTAPLFPPVVAFPEGTTVNSRHVIAWQRGAFVPGVPVQPVALDYPFRRVDVSLTPDTWNVGVLCRMLFQVYNRMVVTYLPVYTPNDVQRARPEVFAASVRAQVARVLGRSVTRFTDRDALLYGALLARGRATLPAQGRRTSSGHGGRYSGIPQAVLMAAERRYTEYAVAHVLKYMSTKDAERVLHVQLALHAIAEAVVRFADADADGDGMLNVTEVRGGVFASCGLYAAALLMDCPWCLAAHHRPGCVCSTCEASLIPPSFSLVCGPAPIYMLPYVGRSIFGPAPGPTARRAASASSRRR
jgi:hypothetical protein